MSWKPIVLIVRGLAAMIIGYGVIALLTSWGFYQIRGHQSLYGGSPSQLLAGTILAVVSGLIGGAVAGFIGPLRGASNATLVLVLLTVDTVYVLFFSKSTVPIWFDAIGSGTLMLFTIVGGLLVERTWRRREKAA